MWTLIHKDDYQEFIQSKSNLQNYSQDLILNEVNGYYFLPRLFYYKYPHHKLILYEDPSWKPKYHNLDFLGELDERQKKVISTFFHTTNQYGIKGGGLKSPPGSGKTVMGVAMSCYSKLKTLIIINNSKLEEQWEDSINKFTNCKQVGKIQGDSFNIEHPFTIAMVQTLLSKTKNELSIFYEKIREAGFGLVLIDEYHSCISGPQYAKSSLVLNTPNIIGLSATPYGDSSQLLFMEGIVGLVQSESSTYQLKPTVNIIRFDSGLTPKYGKQIKFINDLYMKRAKYNSFIMESDIYKNLVKRVISKSLEQNHRVFSIMITKKQIDKMIEYLKKENIDAKPLYAEKGKRDVDKENDVNIIATYKFAGEGFDFKQLSCLCILVPLSGKKSLIQTIGRVLRTYEGKNQPVVYVFLETGFNHAFSKDLYRIEGILENEFKCDVNIFDI
jgi:superfamily II DNA or RNA helicase